MKSNKFTALVLVGSLALLVGSACGSENRGFEESAAPTEPDGGLGNPSSSGGIGSSGAPGKSDGGGDSGLGACGAQTQTAKQVPLDILIMLDASGSMMGATGTGSTKWASVKSALTSFITDPQSAGIGVGLQVFPIPHPGAPSSCTSSAQCTAGAENFGACDVKVCENDTTLGCNTSADCGGAPCRERGNCETALVTLGKCLVGDSCFVGKCVAVGTGECNEIKRLGGRECFLSDYSTAAVPIAPLPSNAPALTSKIVTLPNPPNDAFTPTSVAVQGGLVAARQYADSHPGHAVVMVLATDGLPTVCAPLDASGIGALAAAVASGTPSVKTFVIGVFADAEQAEAVPNLDQIAAGGGTGKALMISSGGDVIAAFRTALEKIRGTALPCEYEVPNSSGGTPDYGKVNVQFTPTSGAPILGHNVKNVDACDEGGWYYDVDPASGGRPTKIVLCPASCTAVKKDVGTAKIDILLGCKTIVK